MTMSKFEWTPLTNLYSAFRMHRNVTQRLAIDKMYKIVVF